MKKIYLLIFICFSFCSLAQEKLENKIFDPKIKTVLMYLENDELSMPILELGGSQYLTLGFDNFDLDIKDYYYTIKHCNSDWTLSDLDPSDYIDGYFEGQISEYQSSFNTNVNYVHYKLKFPNEDMRPKVSGNYVIYVYEDYDSKEAIFYKRFMVVENKSIIEAKVRNMNQAALYSTDQQIEIEVNYPGSEFYDISQNLKVQILKNHNWVNYLELTRPDIIRDNKFTYNDFSRIKFQGINEFHHFNTKNIHFYSENIVNISFVDNMYHFQLSEDKIRTYDTYTYRHDINGHYKIDVTKGEFPETEADYVYVYFTLKMATPIKDDNELYVWGGLSNFEFTNHNKMRYNFEQKAYECRLFLKQGYYDYQYVLSKEGKKDFAYIEGNHARTENTYTILSYYHDYSYGYDRLIGIKEISSKI
ncbi:MAG: DUF5103 domain-containing protein [Bacteroidales bacterium]|nr:DUF5103 domain-containing protein [Bacteroidales bacterium]